MTMHMDSSLATEAVLDSLVFRSIMRTMASGVTIITTSYRGQPHGMTATAFSSVAAEPPTVLIVLNRSTRTHPMIAASRHFAVNFLSADQTELGSRFAGKLDNQFDGVEYALNEHGVPLLAGVVATLECETIDEFDVATHTIFIGRVMKGASGDTLPLIYHDGNFKSVANR